MKTTFRLTCAMLVALASSGCVFTTYTHPDGAKFTRFAIGATQNVGAVDLKTRGGDSLAITGYSSESTQTAAAVVTAAVSAATRK